MDRDSEQRMDGDDVIEISEEIQEIEEIIVPENAGEPAPGAAPVAPFGAVPYAVGWQRVLSGQVFKQYYRFFFAFVAIFIGSAWSQMTISNSEELASAVSAGEAYAEKVAAVEKQIAAGTATEADLPEIEPYAVKQIDSLHNPWGPVFLFIGALGVLAMGMAVLSPRFQIKFGPIFLAVVPFVWGFYYFGDVMTAHQDINGIGDLFAKAAPGADTDFATVGRFFRNLGPGFFFIWLGALVVELSFLGSIFSSMSAEKKKKKEAAAARASSRGGSTASSAGSKAGRRSR